MTRVFESEAPEATLSLAEAFSKELCPGDIVCLNGELGVGKTVFTKGLAKGLGVTEDVVSPTFTILQEYRSGCMPLFHFDVYRIEDPDEMNEIGFEEYFFGDGVTVVEWSTLIAELIPPNAKKVLIEKDPSRGFDYRKITITEVERQ